MYCTVQAIQLALEVVIILIKLIKLHYYAAYDDFSER